MTNIFSNLLLDLIKKHHIKPVDFDQHDMTISDLGRGDIYSHDTPAVVLTDDAVLYGMASDVVTIAHNYKMDIKNTRINLVIEKLEQYAGEGHEVELHAEHEEYGDMREIYNYKWLVYSVSYAHHEAETPNTINIKLRTL